MVMRFEQGRNFEAWLTSLGRPPTQDELDAITAAVLRALETMHAADFLHRDIAPDNIIVRADGSPVLLDFGAARRAVAQMSRSLTGIVKAGYSPHEQYSAATRLRNPRCASTRTTCPRRQEPPRAPIAPTFSPPSIPVSASAIRSGPDPSLSCEERCWDRRRSPSPCRNLRAVHRGPRASRCRPDKSPPPISRPPRVA